MPTDIEAIMNWRKLLMLDDEVGFIKLALKQTIKQRDALNEKIPQLEKDLAAAEYAHQQAYERFPDA